MPDMEASKYAARQARCADELQGSVRCRSLEKYLVAKNADGTRKNPMLWELLAPTDTEGMSESAIAEVMDYQLREAIMDYNRNFRFRKVNKNIDASTFQFICLTLLGFPDSCQADERRYRVIDEIGGGYDIGTWRRAHGPEREVFRRLAEHLLEWFAEDDEEDDDVAA